MRSFVLIIFSLVVIASRCTAADSGFINPPDEGSYLDYRFNEVYRIGDVINITWVPVDDDEVDLTLEMGLPNEPYAAVEDYKLTVLQKNYTEKFYRYVLDLTTFREARELLDERGIVFMYFSVSVPLNRTHYTLKSEYFNVTNPEPMTTTSTSTLSTSTPTMTSTPTSTVIPGHQNADKSPSGAVIGGAVGGAVGGLLILGAIAFFVWRRLRKDKTPPDTNEAVNHHYSQPDANEWGRYYYSSPEMVHQQPGGWGPMKPQVAPEVTAPPEVHEAP
ncbi:hypothetical protein FQN49_002736 [Arthroderma sp. PD_2]|nr:hypothetical protein FQN49_002736 [Arthroderma sp. PD_2]